MSVYSNKECVVSIGRHSDGLFYWTITRADDSDVVCVSSVGYSHSSKCFTAMKAAQRAMLKYRPLGWGRRERRDAMIALAQAELEISRLRKHIHESNKQ